MAESRAPNFMPPKKRAGGKKGPGANAHGDFIMSVKGQGRSPVTSPSEEELDKIERIGELDPMVSKSATPDSQLIESISTTDQSRSPSLDIVSSSSRRKKRVNICTENSEDPLMARGATTASSSSLDRSESAAPTPSSENFLTLTGTIKRGRKAGQSVDVQLNMSREELEVIEATIASRRQHRCFGLHVLLFSLLCAPLVTVAALVYNFYVGTITWYNVFSHCSSTRVACCWRLLCPPLLILGYPFFIVPASVLLGLYAGVVQVCCDLALWKAHVQDLEKGFFGSLCSALRLEDCAPYEVVVLVDLKPPPLPSDA